jgi:CelD/BcsL family acetyltransferase involved in cellulose biosynthesis
VRVQRLSTVADLRAAATSWDDLWRRSDAALPTLRADLIGDWLEHFAPRARIFALTVAGDDGRLVAALPLVGQRLKCVLSVGGLPNNPWNLCGDLLWDPQAGVAPLDALAVALRQLPWSLAWLDSIPLEAPRWLAFRAALDRQGLVHLALEEGPVGQVAIGPSWEAYTAGWSRNHRQKMRKALGRLERAGGAALRLCRPTDPRETDSLVRLACDVEDRSWKGPAGTSILRTPGALDYFIRLARRLAAADQLELAILEHDGGPVAVSLGYRAKGVVFAHKVGYDEAHAAASPMHALLHLLLQRYFAAGDVATLDFLGPLQDWTSKWSTSTYNSGRLMVATGPAGRALLHGYRHWWPRLAALRRKPAAAEPTGDRATDAADVPPDTVDTRG